MKNQSRWIFLILAALVMLAVLLFLDRQPERYVKAEKQEMRVDTVSVKLRAVDSLFTQFSSLNNVQVIKDASDAELFKVTLKNLNNPDEILSKDWENSGLREASIEKEGFKVEVTNDKPYDVLIQLRRGDDFVLIPAGVLFALLYPKK